MQTDIDRFVDDGSLEDNVESFLSHDDADPRGRVARCSDVGKGMMNPDFYIGPNLLTLLIFSEDVYLGLFILEI